MPGFFVTPGQVCDGRVRIEGDDAHHISRSLRMAVGEHISVRVLGGGAYDCVLESFDETVTAKIVGEKPADTEPPFRVHLFQGLPKGDKLDTVIQKAVECGVYEITPFESERSIVKIKPDAEKSKTERRCRIALEAAKQSGRGIIPNVCPSCGFEEMLSRASGCGAFVFCYEGEGTRSLKSVLLELRESGKNVTDIALVVGPEGGFSEKEAEHAASAGAAMTGLGARILRTETAAAFALAGIVYEFEL